MSLADAAQRMDYLCDRNAEALDFMLNDLLGSSVPDLTLPGLDALLRRLRDAQASVQHAKATLAALPADECLALDTILTAWGATAEATTVVIDAAVVLS